MSVKELSIGSDHLVSAGQPGDRDFASFYLAHSPAPFSYGLELELRRPLVQRSSDNRHEGVTLRDLILRGRKNSGQRVATPHTRPGSSSSVMLGSQV